MEININGQYIGSNHPVFIIAEGCDNHLGDLQVAFEMAREAKRAGANAIKFQHHLPYEEMLPDTPMSDNFDEKLTSIKVKLYIFRYISLECLKLC